MSYKVVKLVLGADPEKLRPAMKRFVLAVLAEHAQHDGTEVRPGLPRLARLCGLSIDAVYRWRKMLRVEGWIICTRKATNKKPGIYRIDIKKLQDAAWKGLRADSAPAQSQSTEVDSAAAQSRVSAPAQSQNGLDSALAPTLDSAPAQSNPSSSRPVLQKGTEREGSTLSSQKQTASETKTGAPLAALAGKDRTRLLEAIDSGALVPDDFELNVIGMIRAGDDIPPAYRRTVNGLLERARPRKRRLTADEVSIAREKERPALIERVRTDPRFVKPWRESFELAKTGKITPEEAKRRQDFIDQQISLEVRAWDAETRALIQEAEDRSRRRRS